MSGYGQFVGVAGNYLKSLRPGDNIQVSVRAGSKAFRLPLDPAKTPILLLCAGTGIAPFRGFLQERALQIAAGRQLAPAAIFIGCRSESKDRLYAEELDEWASKGVVTLRYAFSREVEKSEGCKYVHERMLHDKDEVIQLWIQGVKVFVCGSKEVAESIGSAAFDVVRGRSKEMGRDGTDEELREGFRALRNERFVTDVFT